MRELLTDRRRSQRGSALSSVLLMTAFFAILSGALMTELSGNFMLSRTLMVRMANEATINSAVEVAISQLEATPIGAGCPALNAVNLNGRSAVPVYVGCWPTVREQPRFAQIATSSAFSVDGSHSRVRPGQDFYVVGDSAGNVFQFDFAHATLNWWQQLPGSVSGPPVSIPDAGGNLTDVVTLVPLSVQTNQPPGCLSGGCVARLAQDFGFAPDHLCFMGANGPVGTSPAAGVNNPSVALFGDQAGWLFAYAATEIGNCALLAGVSTGTQPVVAGPVVFAGPTTATSRTDEIYLVTSDGASSRLLQYAFTVTNGAASLSWVSTLGLPSSSAVGLAADSATVPARLAIAFAGGTVGLVQVQAGYGLALLATTAVVPPGIADAPSWCCGSSPTSIGVAQTHGLYVLDGSLRLVASYGLSTASLSKSPASDPGGDWFFGADDGNLYEVPAISSQPTFVSFGANQLGQLRSSAQVGACAVGACVYLASSNGAAYVVPLDARDAVITACVSASPPDCSGSTPYLRANIEVGASGNPQSVHVQGWSYYSP